MHNWHIIYVIITCSRYDIVDAPGWVHHRHHIYVIITCSNYDIADVKSSHYGFKQQLLTG